MVKQLNILYITGNIEEVKGGPGTTTRMLCNALIDLGHKVDLLTLDVDPDYLNSIDYSYKIYNIKTLFKKNIWGGLGIEFPKFILTKYKNYDFFLINSLWGVMDFFLLFMSTFLNLKGKVMIFPHGCLDKKALEYSYLKKKLYNIIIQNPLIKIGNPLWGALTNKEKQDILSIYPFVNEENIAIIPNGVIIPKLSKEYISNIRKKFNLHKYERVFTYIGRFHPKKNIENTIKAFISFNKENDNKNVFLLFGPENELYNYLKNRYENKYVKFLGYIKGDEKFAILKNTDIFVLVSYSEGLPMAVLEAIGSGCKVVISNECNIEGVDKLGLGIYSKHRFSDIEKSFRQVVELVYDNKGVEIFMRKYNWDKSAKLLEKFLQRKSYE